MGLAQSSLCLGYCACGLSVAAEESGGVEAHQQGSVVPGYFEVGFALVAVTQAEGEGDFFHGTDAAADQHLKEELEAGTLEFDFIDSGTADHEEAGHGVVGAGAAMLDGPGDRDGGGRDGFANGVPLAGFAARSVAAADGEVGSVGDGLKELREQVGRVLEIGVHDAEHVGIGGTPAIEDRAGKAALAFADEKTDAGVFFSFRCNEGSGAV